jgi:hypothetical protein
MSDAGEFFKSREATLAAGQPPLDSQSVAVINRTARRLHRRDIGLKWSASIAGLGVLAVGVVAALQLGADQDPLAPSPSASDSASVEPSPSVQTPGPVGTLIEGFAPVPQLPAEEIPWDEVGPGWFAVGYYNAVEFPHLEVMESVALSQREGGVSLVAPDGTWYAARDVADLGAGSPLLWDGDNVFMGTRVEAGDDTWYYDINIVDLLTGDSVGGEVGVPWEYGIGIGNGRALSFWWNALGPINGVAGVVSAEAGGCFEAEARGSSGWRSTDMSHLYMPDAGGSLVCFGPAEGDPSRTSITLVDVGEVANSRVVGDLPMTSDRYSFVGWINSDQFMFAQTQRSLPGAEQIFRFDLADGSATPMDLPLYEDVKSSSAQGFFDHVSQRHVISYASYQDTTEWDVALYELDGTPVGSFAGECLGGAGLGDEVRVKVSGERLVIFCDNPGYILMFDLASGDPIGEWQIGTGREVQIDGHRAE